MSRIVCDLGGTGCRMALTTAGTLLPDTYHAMRNAEFASFEDALSGYLARLGGLRPTSIVIALAAPVAGDSVVLSNHHWRLCKARIRESSGIETIDFLNDLEALGYALQDPARLASQPVAGAAFPGDRKTRLVVGVGTGFNSAVCTAGGDVICAEAGHITFPVETALDAWLQSRFTRMHGRCSSERVLSGSGLATIYEGICDAAGQSAAHQDSHAIVSAARGGDVPAIETCHAFCSMLGRTVGDLALAVMPKGGIWLAGGISGALADVITEADGPFMAAFRAKGRMRSGMGSFPIYVLRDQYAALHGCTLWAEAHSRQPQLSSQANLEGTQ